MQVVAYDVPAVHPWEEDESLCGPSLELYQFRLMECMIRGGFGESARIVTLGKCGPMADVRVIVGRGRSDRFVIVGLCVDPLRCRSWQYFHCVDCIVRTETRFEGVPLNGLLAVTVGASEGGIRQLLQKTFDGVQLTNQIACFRSAGIPVPVYSPAVRDALAVSLHCFARATNLPRLPHEAVRMILGHVKQCFSSESVETVRERTEAYIESRRIVQNREEVISRLEFDIITSEVPETVQAARRFHFSGRPIVDCMDSYIRNYTESIKRELEEDPIWTDTEVQKALESIQRLRERSTLFSIVDTVSKERLGVGDLFMFIKHKFREQLELWGAEGPIGAPEV